MATQAPGRPAPDTRHQFHFLSAKRRGDRTPPVTPGGQVVDLAVFIGRFQPLHNGHVKVIEKGLETASRVLVLVGSAGAGRRYYDPFSYEERAHWVEAWAAGAGHGARVSVQPLHDILGNDLAWIAQIQAMIRHAQRETGAQTVGLLGHGKDGTSYYLRLFPDMAAIEAGGAADAAGRVISGTGIRERLYAGDIDGSVAAIVPPCVLDDLRRYAADRSLLGNAFDEAQARWLYRQQWAGAPYEPTFNTCDAVVVQSGHVLLVVRGRSPGRGLLALPGGYLQPDESMFVCAIRELREETRIDVPDKHLLDTYKGAEVFDDPRRDPRGRIVTKAHLFRFADMPRLPKVRGADDAQDARWVHLGDLRESEMFADHFHIVRKLLGMT
ncbi:MAG: NUDIX domain-containing protein [Alphaproteobacteria bacterium]|nr:NUDIX domain-containing protein [Alphaproteobacteria bacterium]